MIDWNFKHNRYRCYNFYTDTYSGYVSSERAAYEMALDWIGATTRAFCVKTEFLYWDQLIAGSMSPEFVTYLDYFKPEEKREPERIRKMVVILDEEGRIYPLSKLSCLKLNPKTRRYEPVSYIPYRSRWKKISFKFRRGPVPYIRKHCGRYGRRMSYKYTLKALSLDDEQKEWFDDYNIKLRPRTARDSWDIEPFQDRSRCWKDCHKARKSWDRLNEVRYKYRYLPPDEDFYEKYEGLVEEEYEFADQT